MGWLTGRDDDGVHDLVGEGLALGAVPDREQPAEVAGRAVDQGRLSTTLGLGVGLALTALGLVAATIPGLAGILLAALVIGVGTGLITPLAFATLAEHTAPERLGQTMGAAELGRELGDAGGPLLVGAGATTLTAGYTTLAVIIAIPTVAATLHAVSTTRRSP